MAAGCAEWRARARTNLGSVVVLPVQCKREQMLRLTGARSVDNSTRTSRKEFCVTNRDESTLHQ